MANCVDLDEVAHIEPPHQNLRRLRIRLFSSLLLTELKGPLLYQHRGWSGGAMVLGKLPVPGRPTNLDKSRARA